MTTYTLNKYDFKKFLLAELPDTRQEELIFWKKTIPMPVDLIYNIFDYRGELLGKYLDHIGASYLYGYSLKNRDTDWRAGLELQPNKLNKDNKPALIASFRSGLENSDIRHVLARIADLLMLHGYAPDEYRFMDAICHEGRKYKRLYLPKQIREIISNSFPELLECIGLSNWDMFSNVVADELKIYRMGFADAFSGIFNKLIEFIIKHSGSGKGGYSDASGIKIRQEGNTDTVNDTEVRYGLVSDGSIWEPRYVNAGSSFVLNKHHPFIDLVKSRGEGAQQVFSELIGSLSEIENETIKDSERKTIEVLRQNLSRKLRLQTEKLF